MPPVKAISWLAPCRVTIQFPTNAAVLTAPNVAAFIADADYILDSATEIHETLGTDGGAVSLDVVKCTGTTAASAGTTMLAAVFNLKATINTVVRKDVASGTLAAASSRRITKGDRIAIKFNGTLTALTGICVTLVLRPTIKKPSW